MCPELEEALIIRPYGSTEEPEDMNTTKPAHRRGQVKPDKSDSRRMDYTEILGVAASRAKYAIERAKAYFAATKQNTPLDLSRSIMRREKHFMTKFYGSSTWKPHQGAQECARRRRQMGMRN